MAFTESVDKNNVLPAFPDYKPVYAHDHSLENDTNVGQPQNYAENGMNEYIPIFEVKKIHIRSIPC